MRTKYYIGSGDAIYAEYLRMKPFWRRSHKKIPKKVTLFLDCNPKTRPWIASHFHIAKTSCLKLSTIKDNFSQFQFIDVHLPSGCFQKTMEGKFVLKPEFFEPLKPCTYYGKKKKDLKIELFFDLSEQEENIWNRYLRTTKPDKVIYARHQNCYTTSSDNDDFKKFRSYFNFETNLTTFVSLVAKQIDFLEKSQK